MKVKNIPELAEKAIELIHSSMIVTNSTEKTIKYINKAIRNLEEMKRSVNIMDSVETVVDIVEIALARFQDLEPQTQEELEKVFQDIFRD